MPIDLSSFQKALDSLDRGLAKAGANPQDEELRDGAIQRFEYTYELAWKSLKRVLESISPSAGEIDALSFKDLIRIGFEKRLIEDVAQWFEFREERNISSHTYDERKAVSVYKAAKIFAPAARRLLLRLEETLE
jgi:nucleotidyltransferase substrate binding protein (TIGR01987 family)